MTDETDPHPIARASLYERMSNIAREAGGNPAPSPIEAARAHLGSVADLIPDQAAIAPRGSVEDAMIAGADLETGELPAREADLPTASSGTGVSPLAHTIPPAAPSVTAEVEPAMQSAPAPPERQTFSFAPPPPAEPAPRQEVIEPERAIPRQEIIPPQRAAGDVLVAADELRLLVERIERLEEEKAAIGADVKDVYQEAKARGYDAKTMRKIVALRKMETHDRQEAEALLDTYKSALGLDVPYSERRVPDRSRTPLEIAAS